MVEAEDEDEAPADSRGMHLWITFHMSLLTRAVGAMRRPADEMEQDVDVGAYRARYGSGLVNTRIADRETEVTRHNYLTHST